MVSADPGQRPASFPCAECSEVFPTAWQREEHHDAEHIVLAIVMRLIGSDVPPPLPPRLGPPTATARKAHRAAAPVGTGQRMFFSHVYSYSSSSWGVCMSIRGQRYRSAVVRTQQAALAEYAKLARHVGRDPTPPLRKDLTTSEVACAQAMLRHAQLDLQANGSGSLSCRA